MLRTSASSSSHASKFFAPPAFPFPDVNSSLFDVESNDNNDDSDSSDDTDDDTSSSSADLFDAHEFYTLEHDLLLVKHRCFQPELAMHDVAQRFEKEFAIARTPEQLEQRFETLQSPAFQALFALYLQAISLNKDAHYASGAYAILPEYQSLLRTTRTSCETKLFQLLYDDDKFQSEPNEMINVEITGRSFPKYTRNVSKTQLCRCAGALQQLFKTQGAQGRVSRHQAFALVGANTRVERLQLTDAVAFYDSCSVYSHLEQPIFDRFVQFAKDPHLMERLELLRQQLIESSHLKRDTHTHLTEIFATQHQQHMTKLDAMRVAECDQMQSQLERVLEDDIQHLRRMHETLLRHEHAKIRAKYDAQIAALNTSIDAMRDATLALQTTCEANGWDNLERDIMQAALQVERIFGSSDYVVRLLILAEDFDAEPLRRALVSYLSEPSKFPQFALRREMTSKMIPDTTVLEILKRCPTTDLRELESAGNRFLHHELVARELHTRRVAFGRLLSSLPNDRLRAAVQYVSSSSSSRLMSGSHTKRASLETERAHADNDALALLDSAFVQQIAAATDFPDVLEHELARRRDFSCVKMSSQFLERLVSFSEEDCLLQLEVPHRYCTVLATKERKQGESGKWMYEATIEIFGGDGESILLGWEVPRGHAPSSDDLSSGANARAPLSRAASSSTLLASPAAAAAAPRGGGKSATAARSPPEGAFGAASAQVLALVPGLSPSADGRSFGVTWQSDSGLDMGILHANGQSRSGVPCFRAGDVVGCTINQDDAVPHLCFYLNGEQVLPSVSSSSRTGAPHHSAGIAVQNPPSCLFPALAMYSSKKKPQMRVRFNFRGDFAFPLAGFEPYGAPL